MKIKKIKDVRTPERGTDKSAGLDFFVPNDFWERTLTPGQAVNIGSGIKVEVPSGHMLVAFNKSGVALKKGLQVGACVIDEDYQGELHLHVTNISDKATVIRPGEKLVQFILVPVVYEPVEVVDEIHGTETERGEGNFGHTDAKGIGCIHREFGHWCTDCKTKDECNIYIKGKK